LLYYFTSEQLFGPTGSLKQLDIAITAASIDASSPYISQKKIQYSFSTKPCTTHTKSSSTTGNIINPKE